MCPPLCCVAASFVFRGIKASPILAIALLRRKFVGYEIDERIWRGISVRGGEGEGMTCIAVAQATQEGSAKRQASGLVNFVHAVAYHFCLNLPAAFTQPGAHLLA